MNIRAQIFGYAESRDPILKQKQPKGVRRDELHSIPVDRQEGRRGNTRQQDRHRLSGETARLTHDGRTIEVELINVSGGGAMVSGDFEPMIRDEVQLQLGPEGTIDCAVLWMRNDRVGLQFAHETRLDCSEDEQADVLREVIVRSFPDVAFAPRVEDAGTSEQRRATRHPMIWSGALHYDFQSTTVRVRNISATGAMVELSVTLPVGAEPTLELSERACVPCTVAWSVGDQLGLQFHKPFDLSLLATSRPNVQDSAEDSCWEHATVDDLRHELEGFLKR